MRVVLLSTFHEQCGIATHAEGLAAGLSSCGAEVEVLAPRLQKGDAGWGEQPQRLWKRNRAFGFEALGVMRAIEAFRPDVVHAQVNLSLFSSRVLYNIGYLLKRAGIPFVATLHGRKGGSWGRNFKLWRLMRGLASADVIVHSVDHQNELGRDRVHIISPGLPRREPRAMLDARRALDVDPETPVLAHFGFLVPDKGIAEMIRAVAELARGPVPNVFYWIAGAVYGSDESRAHFEDLQKLVVDLGIGNHVRLTGEFLPEEEAIGELEAANWIVLNYRTGGAQGASGAVRRALSAGRPVAVSSAPVFDDVRTATHTLGSPLATSLAEMLANRPLADAVAARGRALCEEQTWDRVAAKHIALYESIIRQKASSQHRPGSPAIVSGGP